MTDKVRRRLVYKYTAIIAVMLLFFAVGGFAMCKYAVQKVIADTMYDAVAAEIREAEDAGVNENTPLKEMSAASDIGSIYSYAYWFAGDRLVFAEHPKDPAVDAVCRRRLPSLSRTTSCSIFRLTTTAVGAGSFICWRAVTVTGGW